MIDWLRRPDPAVEIDGRILPIAIRRHTRARRLTMRLAPDGSAVRVTLPTWCSSREALVFASSRLDWLESQLAKVPRAEPPMPGGMLPYRGAALAIDWVANRHRTPKLAGETLAVGGPVESLPARRAGRSPW